MFPKILLVTLSMILELLVIKMTVNFLLTQSIFGALYAVHKLLIVSYQIIKYGDFPSF